MAGLFGVLNVDGNKFSLPKTVMSYRIYTQKKDHATCDITYLQNLPQIVCTAYWKKTNKWTFHYLVFINFWYEERGHIWKFVQLLFTTLEFLCKLWHKMINVQYDQCSIWTATEGPSLLSRPPWLTQIKWQLKDLCVCYVNKITALDLYTDLQLDRLKKEMALDMDICSVLFLGILMVRELRKTRKSAHYRKAPLKNFWVLATKTQKLFILFSH